MTPSGPAAGLLIGTHTHAGDEEAGRRQAAAAASLQALTRVSLVNVQPWSAPHEVSGIRTLPVLKHSSTAVTKRPGPVKPLVRETFDALASEAASLGLPYFCFTNADIIFSQEAVGWILDSGRDACLLSREDFDGATGESLGICVHGIDAIAVATMWWRRNRRRFRDYIVGESTWDNVYASILLCHADAAIENRLGLIRHESHDTRWAGSPFADYTRLLAAHDAGYFSLWCEYLDRLEEMRAASGSPEQEEELARATFGWAPSLLNRAVQAGRSAKARVRYALTKP